MSRKTEKRGEIKENDDDDNYDQRSDQEEHGHS